MTVRVLGVRGVAWCLVAFALAAAAPASRALQPEPEMMYDAGPDGASVAAMLGARFGPPGTRRDGGPGMERGGLSLVPPFIQLTEQQQDKVFELRHAQEPSLRAQFKELRDVHTQLRTLALADNYDETRAKQLVARAAQASGEIELMHTRLQHAVFALLTPEQRKRIDECKPGTDGLPPRGCMPPR